MLALGCKLPVVTEVHHDPIRLEAACHLCHLEWFGESLAELRQWEERLTALLDETDETGDSPSSSS